MSSPTATPATMRSEQFALQLVPLYAGHGSEFLFVHEGRYRCGSASDCDVRIESQGIEPSHCEFIRSKGSLSIQPGTGRIWINDLPVRRPQALRSGDQLAIGPLTYRVRRVSSGVLVPTARPRPSSPPEHPASAPQTITQLRNDVAEQTRPPEPPGPTEPSGFPLKPVAAPAAESGDGLNHIISAQLEQLSRLQLELQTTREAIHTDREIQAAFLCQCEQYFEHQLGEKLQELIRREAEFETRRSRSAIELAARESQLNAREEEIQLLLARLREEQRIASEMASQAALNESRTPPEAQAPSPSVEELAALATERESILRARDEAASVQVEARRTLAELDARSVRLGEWEAELRTREQALAADAQSLESERSALESSHKAMLCQQNALVQQANDLNSLEAHLRERELAVSRQTEELRTRSAGLHERAVEALESGAPASPEETAAAHIDAARIDASREQLLQRVAEAEEHLERTQSELEAVTGERTALLEAVQRLQSTLQAAHADLTEAMRLKQQVAAQEEASAQLYRQLDECNEQLQLFEARRLAAEERAATLEARLQELSEQSPRGVNELAADREPGTTESDVPGRSRDAGAGNAQAADDCQEQLLLNEIDALRKSLRASAESDQLRHQSLQNELSLRDEAIRQLQEELEASRRAASELAVTSENVADLEAERGRLQQQLQQAQSDISERESLIREMTSQIQSLASSAQESARESERLAVESRELDRRAERLDDREQELLERDRLTQQAADDVEAQRRQLLESRQQLEIARAEIQVASRWQQTETGAAAATTSPSTEALSAAHAVRQEMTAPSAPSTVAEGPEDTRAGSAGSSRLRHELASLFGIRASDSHDPPKHSIPAGQELDLSEPGGRDASVALRFDSDATPLVEAPVSDAEASESTDDFVREYMEQLLARSRKAAGNALPHELQVAESRAAKSPSSTSSTPSVPAPAVPASPSRTGSASHAISSASAVSPTASKPAPAAKSGPKVKSFIEQYMSGGLSDLGLELTPSRDAAPAERPEPAPVADQSATVSGPQPVLPRTRIDIQKLRENMDSFRTISTQSVEQALVNHALRQERLTINGRIALAAVLLIMALFLTVATASDLVDQPLLAGIAGAGAIAAGMDLARTYSKLRRRCRELLQPEDGLANRLHASGDPPAAEMPAAPATISGIEAPLSDTPSDPALVTHGTADSEPSDVGVKSDTLQAVTPIDSFQSPPHPASNPDDMRPDRSMEHRVPHEGDVESLEDLNDLPERDPVPHLPENAVDDDDTQPERYFEL